MNLCPDQETCDMYGRADNLPKNHDVRSKYKCLFWDSRRNGKCMKEGEACNLEKVQRIKKKL